MFESEIALAVIVGSWILYELYGRFISDWLGTSYVRIAGGIAIIGYLYWQMKDKPADFQETLGLAKQLLIAPGSSLASGSTKEKRNVTNAMKKVVGAKYQWKCAGCKTMLDEGYQVDHIIPLFKNGSNELDNLQPLCGTCHNKKSIKESIGI